MLLFISRLEIISKNFNGIFLSARNVILTVMSYRNLSRLHTTLCSRKVNKLKTTCCDDRGMIFIRSPAPYKGYTG